MRVAEVTPSLTGDGDEVERDDTAGVDSEAEEESDVATASVGSTVLGLSNNIVGAGMLSLPWATKESSIVEGMLLVLFVAVVSALSLIMTAICCEVTKCFTFRGMGEKVLGHGFGLVIQGIMMIYTFLSCVSFMILAADFFTGEKGIPHGLCKGRESCQWIVDVFETRAQTVLVLTILVLFPLSCLRQLNALRFTSLLSVMGMFYLLWLLIYEYASASSEDLANVTIRWTTPEFGIFRAAPIANVAFIAHYNVPRFYQELQDRTISKFSKAVVISLGMCTGVYLMVGVFGYLRYGEETKSDVLNNLPDDSTVAIVGRLALAGVVLFTYPLAFNSHRASVVALLQVYAPKFSTLKPLHFFGLTLVLVAFTFLLGATLKDIGIVLQYKGAVLGGCIGFAFPGWMFLAGVYPRSVNWCCVKPKTPLSHEDAGSTTLEQGLLEDTADGTTSLAKQFSPRWKSVAIFFFYYAVIMGVLGTITTTLKVIHPDPASNL